MVKIFKIYILPHLDYCAPLWNSLPKEEETRIENVQRKFTRIINGCQGLEYEERLTLLELVPLRNRREYLDLVQAYRIIRKIDVLDHDVLVQAKATRSTRASQKSNVEQLACRLGMRKRFFTCRVASEWNKLPHDIQKTTNIEEFKAKLRTHLFC